MKIKNLTCEKACSIFLRLSLRMRRPLQVVVRANNTNSIKSKMLSIKKAYLVAFNCLSALLWLDVLTKGVFHIIRGDAPLSFWKDVTTSLLVAQHLALLEIVHSALGLVGSPLFATFVQVISRIFMLDLFTYPAEECHEHFSLYLMVVSWSLVEVPRYSFYAAQLLVGEKKVPFFLFNLRYSLFMVLYPTGISGEILQQVASYPFWNQNDLQWMIRLSHVVLVFLYIPLSPFMIWNMWNMRKRAFKKRAEVASVKPLVGLVWPVTNKGTGERSTTDTAKKIFSSAARGAKTEKGDEVAKKVEKERNWRFGYSRHIASHVSLCCESTEVCLDVAKAGLDAAYSLFTFAQDGKEVSFADALQMKQNTRFYTGKLEGRDFLRSQVVHLLQVPYREAILDGEDLLRQCDNWAQKGTIEGSASEAIKLCATNAQTWMDLSDVLFILLGAASAMGPLQNLLDHGATVVALDLKRPNIWKKLFKTAADSRGSIVYPLAKDGLISDEEKIENAGCDMLADTMAICDWLDKVIDENPGKKIVCGNYTYLDGALHVQLALAGDAIMQRLCAKSKDVSLAFLCTPTDDHVIPNEARAAARAAFESSTWWQRALTSIGMLTPNFALPVVNHHCIIDGIVTRQGPNYALAKRIQHWRAIIARSSGHIVSSNIAPSTATQSVVSNPQFAAGYYGWRYFSPLEVFLQETSSAVMFALLVHDLRNPSGKSNPKFQLEHPLNLFSFQSFHGGIWRCGFSIDSVGVPAAISYYAKFYAAHAGVVVAAISGAINYIVKGKVI